MNQFWMVYSPGGTYPPRVQHFSEGKAVAECERLARHNPGEKFYVLEATEFRVVDNLQRGRFKNGVAVGDNGEEIPF